MASITNFIRPVYRSSPSPAEIAGYFFCMRIDLFETEDGQCLKFYINDKDQIYIQISDGSNDIMNSQYIALYKHDVLELAKSLKNLAKYLPDNFPSND